MKNIAGHFDGRGCFLPSAAGPNPAREFSGDNVGNLTVLARVQDGGRTVEGHGHLIVTVQRWILRRFTEGALMQTTTERLEWNAWNGHLVRTEADAYLLHVPTTAVFGVDSLGLSVIEHCREAGGRQRR